MAFRKAFSPNSATTPAAIDIPGAPQRPENSPARPKDRPGPTQPTSAGSKVIRPNPSRAVRSAGSPPLTPDMSNLIPVLRNDPTLRGYPSAALAEKYGLTVDQIETCKREAIKG